MSCQYSRPTLQVLLTAFASLLFFAVQAWAAPHSNFARRSSGGNGGSKVAAPIIAAVVFLFAVPLVFYRKTVLSKLQRTSLYSMLAPRPASTTVRDLTAEEIAGTAATNQAQATAPSRPERRARRTRRTPSQISTRSLPAYMKEPGEHELVIIQGSQDMEDAPLTAQVVMPPVSEDEDESANSQSHDMSQTSSYVIVNDDALVQTPLLEPDDSNGTTHERDDPNDPAPVQTVDISDIPHNDQSSPLLDNPELSDPRGEAPPYFEVVGDLAEAGAPRDLARVETTDTLPIAPDTMTITDTESSTAPVTRRRSVFRGLIDAASRALSQPHVTPHPPRTFRPSVDVAASSPSPRPSDLSIRPARTRSPHVGHRGAQSGSGSALSIASSALGRAMSRTGTRSVSNVAAGLTSPSMISIGSISAPLTHTAVRTDFVYPRSGPTPQQLKLISSVESVSKFGVPYGPDAVAYASASLVNLHGPPPDFEERTSLDGVPGPSDSTMRARSRSTHSRMLSDGNAPESRPPQSPSSSSSPPRRSSATSALASSESEIAASLPPPETGAPSKDPPNAGSAFEPFDTFDEVKEQSPSETAPPRAPSPSPTVGTISTITTAPTIKATASELVPVTESPHDTAISSSRQPSRPGTATSTTRKVVVPSSFRMPSTPPGRAHLGSRSSSIETFRTALSGGHEQTRGSERGMSDTENETDSFTDAEGGAETETETTLATPIAAAPAENRVLGPEPHSLSV
ncbi:hypothetical protein BJV78DRAFT_1207095 [Lactifluus subvellereus]|nr:hypothetical protein BJV78DRAFT_1207095 [Lactifluus subvellereus]